MNLKRAREIVGNYSLEEMEEKAKQLEDRDFLWLESEIDTLRALKILIKSEKASA